MKYKSQSSNLVQLVQVLSDGQYHRGDDLGEHLGCSRAAVWKMISLLKSYGVEIESKKPEGYCLKQPLHLLSADRITQQLDEPLMTEVFESVDSTNTYLMNLEDGSHPRLCVAEQQISGKGRLGRQWISPFGKNIYFSYLWPYSRDVSTTSGLSLVVGLSLLQVLSGLGLSDLKLKWPNDLYLSGQKLAGVLIEMKAESHSGARLVIGCGINVNDHMAADDRTSVTDQIGYQNRNQLIPALLNQLRKDLALFEKSGLEPFQDAFNQVDFLKGKSITVSHHQGPITGVAQGIDDRGLLLLQNDAGIHHISAGDASISKSLSSGPES